MPTLDEIANDPSKATGLDSNAARVLLARSVVAQAALLTPALGADPRMVATDGKNNTRHSDPRFLDIPAVAELLAVPKTYAYELARRGELPTVKVGPKYVRVRRDDLEKWMIRLSDPASATMRRTKKAGGR